MAPAAIGRFMAREVGFQQEGFEEPGGMPQVPLGRTGIGHALQAEVLRFQTLDQALAVLPYRLEPLQEPGDVRRGVCPGAHGPALLWGRP